ncbi:tyrosine-type recombinase/integrase [uncultured Thiodictyon sp.]|jgi:integrase|uniref:tyrosine-type recombinase/integrase n=1 Tax=uncultured Thiodictyon sp. TaxID=1846217 RepID=UPI0025FAEBF6|nr:tyrosine-type recombinase/integrase [uncultured Thiodictyon sp.]
MSHWSTMQERVTAYLTARRRLGYALRIEGEQLQRFTQFADARGHSGPITAQLALEWACASARSGPIGRARRLEVVRPFAKFCAAFEAETQIPPAGALGPAHRRLTPHIYTDEEIDQLLAGAGALTPARGLRPASMQCLLGLLAATGLRVSEALHLQRADVDLARGLLCVRQTKFCKSRYVPLHLTASAALSEYAQLREQRLPLSREPAFFLRDDGRPLGYAQALYAFHCIRTQLGWDRAPEGRPRLYDLRHTFACRRLLAWYQEGIDLACAVPLLSTYLGHVKVTDTYWYLTAIPALMSIAGERFERLAQSGGAEATP